MVQSVTYQSETKTVPFQGKTIVLESLISGRMKLRHTIRKEIANHD